MYNKSLHKLQDFEEAPSRAIGRLSLSASAWHKINFSGF